MAEVKTREAKLVEPAREAEAEWVERVTRKTLMTDGSHDSSQVGHGDQPP